MATSIEDINALIAGYTDLKAYFEDQKPRWDGDVTAAQAAYAALAGNLRGVVNTQMYFTATVDPDVVAPTNVAGGTFATLKSAIEAAPAGAYVFLQLIAGKTYPISTAIYLRNRDVVLNKSGVGANPVIAPRATANATSNSLDLIVVEAGSLLFQYCDILLPPKANAALGWSGAKALIGFRAGTTVRLGIAGGIVTSTDPEIGLVNAMVATSIQLGLYQVTLDGPFSAVVRAQDASIVVSKFTVTLLNGASMTDGGTIGTNILQN